VTIGSEPDLIDFSLARQTIQECRSDAKLYRRGDALLIMTSNSAFPAVRIGNDYFRSLLNRESVGQSAESPMTGTPSKTRARITIERFLSTMPSLG